MNNLELRSPNNAGRWLLLIHQIPPKPAYFRVKIWRRLQVLGAVAIKNSVYALPNTEQGHEDFQWTVREILAGGGEAMVCNAELVDGLSDEQVVKMFRSARGADYKEVLQEVKKLAAGPLANGKSAQPAAERRTETFKQLQRLKRRLAEISAIDFFEAASREEAEKRITALEEKLQSHIRPISKQTATPTRSQQYHGGTWITRKGIHVDRIASAWLIRRFLDSAAKFKFVEPQGYRPEPGEVRFDMFDAEFTHEGNNCTFEVLCNYFGLTDPALRLIADVVHDIDLKDSKFGREETRGISRVIAGIAMSHKEDEVRLERGFALFDDLYECLHRQGSNVPRRHRGRGVSRKKN
jgi:hypothetical protein